MGRRKCRNLILLIFVLGLPLYIARDEFDGYVCNYWGRRIFYLSPFSGNELREIGHLKNLVEAYYFNLGEKIKKEIDPTLSLEEKIISLFLHPRIRNGPLSNLGYKKSRKGKLIYVGEGPNWLLEEISYFTSRNSPIEIMIPAYTFKSKNPTRSYPRRFDLAEIAGLYNFKFLSELVRSVYPPGLKFTIISDGEFSSAIYVNNPAPAVEYRETMKALIRLLNLEDVVEIIDLKEIVPPEFQQEYKYWIEYYENGNEWDDPVVKRIIETSINSLDWSGYQLEEVERILTEGHASHPEIYEESKKKAIHYLAMQRAVKELNVYKKVFPHKIRATFHPKPGQLGLNLVNSASRVPPWHGIGGIRRDGTPVVNYRSFFEKASDWIPVYLSHDDRYPVYFQQIPSVSEIPALIFASGKGNRLAPLSHVRANNRYFFPKQVAPIINIPNILHLLKVAHKEGILNFYITLGYGAEEIKRLLSSATFKVSFIEEEDKLKPLLAREIVLDKHKEQFTSHLFWVFHTDVVCPDVPYEECYKYFMPMKEKFPELLGCMGVVFKSYEEFKIENRGRGEFTSLIVDRNNRIVKIIRAKDIDSYEKFLEIHREFVENAPEEIAKLAYDENGNPLLPTNASFYLLSKDILSEDIIKGRYSFDVEVFGKLPGRILAYFLPSDLSKVWQHIAQPIDLLQAQFKLLSYYKQKGELPKELDPVDLPNASDSFKGTETEISKEAHLVNCIIGNNCRIGKTNSKNTLFLDGTIVSGIDFENCIVLGDFSDPQILNFLKRHYSKISGKVVIIEEDEKIYLGDVSSLENYPKVIELHYKSDEGYVEKVFGSRFVELRKKVCEYNKKLKEAGLTYGTSGNISVRDPETGLILIKPSGIPFEELKPEDISVVTLEGDVIMGMYKPSSDLLTHLAIYRANPQVTCIIHTHSPGCMAYACVGINAKDYLGNDIPCLPYHFVDGGKIGEEISKWFNTHGAKSGIGRIFNVKWHGPFAVGWTTLEDLFKLLVNTEDKLIRQSELLFPTKKKFTLEAGGFSSFFIGMDKIKTCLINLIKEGILKVDVPLLIGHSQGGEITEYVVLIPKNKSVYELKKVSFLELLNTDLFPIDDIKELENYLRVTRGKFVFYSKSKIFHNLELLSRDRILLTSIAETLGGPLLKASCIKEGLMFEKKHVFMTDGKKVVIKSSNLPNFIKLIETLGYTCLSLTYAEELIRRYKIDRVQGIPKEEVEKLFDWYNHGGYGQGSAWMTVPRSERKLCFNIAFHFYTLTRRVRYVKTLPSQILSWYVQNELNNHKQELIYLGIDLRELTVGLKHIEDKVRDRFGYEPCSICFPDFSKEFKWKNSEEIKKDLKWNYYFKVFSPEMRKRMLSRIELLREVKVRLSDDSIYPLFDYLENLGDLCCVMLHGGYLFSPNPTDLDLILVEKGDAKWQRVGKEVELIFPSGADVAPQKLDAFKIGIEEVKDNNSLIIWQWGHGVCLYGENIFSIQPSDINLFIKAKRYLKDRPLREKMRGSL